MARRTTGFAVALITAMMVVLLAPASAIAHHKESHPNGASSVTEDDDGDGHPNAPDPKGDADNRHPSGKDRHAEGGASGSQGNSASEPDANGSGPERDEGGLDKPGGAGGLDVLDQDGNNGCGNDDDFEDDNEGLCLGRLKKAEAAEAAAAAAVMASIAGDTSDDDSGKGEPTTELAPAPEEEPRPDGVEATTEERAEATAEDAEAGAVLGVVVQAPTAAGVQPEESGAVLAFTGGAFGWLVALALILSVLGVSLVVAGRRRKA